MGNLDFVSWSLEKRSSAREPFKGRYTNTEPSPTWPFVWRATAIKKSHLNETEHTAYHDGTGAVAVICIPTFNVKK